MYIPVSLSLSLSLSLSFFLSFVQAMEAGLLPPPGLLRPARVGHTKLHFPSLPENGLHA